MWDRVALFLSASLLPSWDPLFNRICQYSFGIKYSFCPPSSISLNQEGGGGGVTLGVFYPATMQICPNPHNP